MVAWKIISETYLLVASQEFPVKAACSSSECTPCEKSLVLQETLDIIQWS